MLVTSEVIKKSGIQFGTSGARGLVVQFTPEVCEAFTHAFISGLEKNFPIRCIAIAIDNRPSSSNIARSCIAALQQRSIDYVYYGVIPTPALAYSAIQDGIPCIMVTGSHIPFDRNGLKFYTPNGEITKTDEQAIFNSNHQFSPSGYFPELIVNPEAEKKYKERYTDFFDNKILAGKRIGIYEHSSAGRDIYAGLFSALGAEVISLERSDEFVPIDTEAVSEEDKIKANTWSKQHLLDAIFSTDGDGDRPLVADEHGQWLRGDILGMLCAEAMGIEALAVPVSCNSNIERCTQFKTVKRTKIGSPYVIAEFNVMSAHYSSIAGFEANGGYLLGSDIQINGKVLKALPTRDAVLPALMLFSSAKESGIASLVRSLSDRHTYSDRVQDFATEFSERIIKFGMSNPESLIRKIGFESDSVISTDVTDGLRIYLSSGDIVHLRPSGNAPELRCYSESSSYEKAKKIVEFVLFRINSIEFEKSFI
ncbi:phosphomannomutase [Pectobacterium versatile]|uniref:phosphomannomutase n=1 Tax=Pectobacterium versatile TaxID=2488639 RepID=UPI00386E105C